MWFVRGNADYEGYIPSIKTEILLLDHIFILMLYLVYTLQGRAPFSIKNLFTKCPPKASKWREDCPQINTLYNYFQHKHYTSNHQVNLWIPCELGLVQYKNRVYIMICQNKYKIPNQSSLKTVLCIQIKNPEDDSFTDYSHESWLIKGYFFLKKKKRKTPSK